MGNYKGKSRHEPRQDVKNRMKHERRSEAKEEINDQLRELKRRKPKTPKGGTLVTSMSNESENKNNRAKIIEIAKMWPNNREVNFETTSTMNLLLLIEESIVVN